MNELLDKIEAHTERYLTTCKAKRSTVQKSFRTHKFRNEIKGWINAIIFAVFAVLLINQYLFQLFIIPSPSMEQTLMTGDRVVVNKTSYGLEPYPGGSKLFSVHRQPERNQIITFYNPDYESKGPIFDILTQILYMSTFSLVNIDVDVDGNPRQRLFVKRTVGLPGDTVKFVNGDAFLKLSGMDFFIKEDLFRKEAGLQQEPTRLLDSNLYRGISAWGSIAAYAGRGINSSLIPQYLLIPYYSIIKQYAKIPDEYQGNSSMYHMERLLDPSNFVSRSNAGRYEQGIYVPKNHILPLGDNRDNSYDGRYFGSINTSEINGRVTARFWPLNRIHVFTER